MELVPYCLYFHCTLDLTSLLVCVCHCICIIDRMNAETQSIQILGRGRWKRKVYDNGHSALCERECRNAKR
jgi:hypothetical protein